MGQSLQGASTSSTGVRVSLGPWIGLMVTWPQPPGLWSEQVQVEPEKLSRDKQQRFSTGLQHVTGIPLGVLSGCREGSGTGHLAQTLMGLPASSGFFPLVLDPSRRLDQERAGGWRWGWGKCWAFSCVQPFGTPWTAAHRLLCPWNSPGKNTGVSSHFLLQGIFQT